MSAVQTFITIEPEADADVKAEEDMSLWYNGLKMMKISRCKVIENISRSDSLQLNSTAVSDLLSSLLSITNHGMCRAAVDTNILHKSVESSQMAHTSRFNFNANSPFK